MGRENLFVRTAQVIIVHERDARAALHRVREDRIPPGDVHMIVIVADADDVPCVIPAADDLPRHVGTEITHPVADILKCF